MHLSCQFEKKKNPGSSMEQMQHFLGDGSSDSTSDSGGTVTSGSFGTDILLYEREREREGGRDGGREGEIEREFIVHACM